MPGSSAADGIVCHVAGALHDAATAKGLPSHRELERNGKRAARGRLPVVTIPFPAAIGRRIDALEAAGYFLPVNMETGQPILNARRGPAIRWRSCVGRPEAGIMAPVSRYALRPFCAAYAKGGERIRLPAIHLLTER